MEEEMRGISDISIEAGEIRVNSRLISFSFSGQELFEKSTKLQFRKITQSLIWRSKKAMLHLMNSCINQRLLKLVMFIQLRRLSSTANPLNANSLKLRVSTARLAMMRGDTLTKPFQWLLKLHSLTKNGGISSRNFNQSMQCLIRQQQTMVICSVCLIVFWPKSRVSLSFNCSSNL
ncbi:hypothetical protein FGO68_gene13401 [Halteria grandinella]|uniref:Uncharacterized protein n=1 Tax=Halteria grandinella TaxID=5974 RepID=A0A8J8T440_HALGN|nr:hypothetical protein FGO68_gene13401 [Halteria grandinella]